MRLTDDAHDWGDAECSSELEEASARLRARHLAGQRRLTELAGPRPERTPYSRQGLHAAGSAWPQGMPTPCDLSETPEQTIARLIKRVNFLESEIKRSIRV